MFDQVIKFLDEPGTIGVIPTDTVYGVIAKANDEQAVSRMYKLKDRDSKPGTLIAANIDQVEELGLKRRYLKSVEQFWPGAVSVIVPCSNQNLNYLMLGKNSLAVRLPDHAELRKLLEITGPLITSSANKPSEPPAENVEQAKKYFGDKVDFYIDGGDLGDNLPSTIIRILDDAVEVIRQGAVKIEDNDKI
jgi:L-threonylcarbamoyladenylate synthase